MLTFMDRGVLAREIDSACRLRGQFTLRSGRTATEYFDKCLFESQPALLRRVSEAMLPPLPGKYAAPRWPGAWWRADRHHGQRVEWDPGRVRTQAGQAVWHPAAR